MNSKKLQIIKLYDATISEHSPDKSFSSIENNADFYDNNIELFNELKKLEIELTKYRK